MCLPILAYVMVNPAIINSIKRYLEKLIDNGIPVSFGVIYGSHVAGNAGKWSDIDLIVVSSQFDKTIDREDINILWRVAARIDSRIEPIPCGKWQWQEDTSCVIIEIARNQGIIVRVTD